MPSFPVLKTGAVAQYPSERVQTFSTQVYRFIDGTEQRFPSSRGVLKRWAIRLELLDEAELMALENFFISQGGRAGSFSFTDPWDESMHANCSFANDEFAAGFGGLGNGEAAVVIKENV